MHAGNQMYTMPMIIVSINNVAAALYQIKTKQSDAVVSWNGQGLEKLTSRCAYLQCGLEALAWFLRMY